MALRDVVETVAAPGVVTHHTDWGPYIALAGVLIGLLFRWWVDLQAHKRELKKSTYGELVRSLGQAVQALASAVDPVRPIREVGEKFARGLEPLTSAQVVARLPLSRALTSMHADLLRISQAVHFERAKLDPLHEAYVFLQSRFQMVANDIDRRNSELEERRVAQPDDTGHILRLQQLIAVKVAEREMIRADMISQGQKAARQVTECCKVLAEGMRGYPKLITAVIGEIRRELGFRFDQKEFLALQEQANKLARELMTASIARILERNGLEAALDVHQS
ncbi:hypothetical protein [Dyella sp.]|uniref:hypothetical protein n=1 Tax=Dyella sp. TaxID=1869338 RepID=UPI003F7D5CC5